MTSLRKFLALLAALTLAAFALPASAADKLFLLFASTYNSSGTPTGNAIPSGTSTWLLLDYANQSPQGSNSVFKSTLTTVPPDVTYTVAKVQTSNNTSCSTTMPSPMPSPGSPGPLGISGTGGSFKLENLNGVKPTGHLCVYIAVTSSLQACTLQSWKGEANTGANFGGGTAFADYNVFTQSNGTIVQTYTTANTNDGCTGVIGCVGGMTNYNNYNSSQGSTDHTYDPDATNTPSDTGGNWGLRRGGNKDDTPCVLVAYQFNPPAGPTGFQVASLQYDLTSGQKASWKYLTTWSAIPVDSSGPTQGWTTFRPWYSWGVTNPVATKASGDFVPGLFCLSDPGDISTLNGAALAALLPTMPNDCIDQTGVNISPNDGPFCNAYHTHPSTFPLGGKAKMCTSQQGFSSGPNNVLYPWTETVDEADGYVGGWQ